MDSDELAVVPRVEQHQADRVDTSVASLQGDAAFESLQISWPRLGLEGMAPRRADDHDVPRAAVPGPGQRDLGQGTEGAVKECSEPSKESGVGGISNGFTGREDPHRQLETDRGEEHRCLLDRQTTDEPTLHAAVVRTGYPDRLSDGLATEISIKATHP